MILVVALLVLLALMGTAFISSARNDRTTAVQHANNTEVDLLLEGVCNVVKSSIVAGLFDSSVTPSFRNPASANYRNYDSCRDDLWLADRIPAKTTAAGGAVYWKTINWPVLQTGTGGTLQFDSPFGGTVIPGNDKSQWRFQPTTFTTAGGSTIPALTVWNSAFTTTLTNPDGSSPPFPFPAADADGDGIADAGLVKLPMGVINGITYYAAVRVIDNNAAINANTAWSRDHECAAGQFTAAGSLPNNGYFPSNIGLYELLRAASRDNEIYNLNVYRFGGTTTAPLTSPLAPVDDTGTLRSDFSFISQGDALYSQMSRRLTNPGYIFAGTKYRPFSISDSIALANRFFLVNPNASRSSLENCFYNAAAGNDSLYKGVPTTGTYGAANFANWFSYNFDYDAFLTSGIPHIRPLLVARNPLSNLTPARAMSVSSLATIKTPLPLLANQILMPDYTTANKPAPKTSINTAPFGELWRGFWNVMADNPATTGTPFGGTTTAAMTYDGNHFNSTSPFAATSAAHVQRMFRSSLRDPRDPLVTPNRVYFPQDQQLLLRAAIAAANAEGLRDSAAASFATVRPRQISLTASIGSVNVTIYPVKPQPFLTEIYANNDNATNPGTGANLNGYYAIELCNPYPQIISLNGWQLAVIDRSSAAAGYPSPGFTVTPIFTFAGTTIPAASSGNPGLLLVENLGNNALYRPKGSQLAATGAITGAIVVPLHQAAGKELVLLRPTTDPTSMAPVDSFDFTGLPTIPSNDPDVANPNGKIITAWHYVRRTDGWRFVYPGRYDANAASGSRHQGTDTATWAIPAAHNADDKDAWATGIAGRPAVTLGSANTLASYPVTFPIQLINSLWPGLNPVAATNNQFPFGGFARNGDILQVPFIGSYRVWTTNINTPLELNSVSIDSAFAEDTDTTDDANEQIGRFCPVSDLSLTTPNGDYTAVYANWRYHWAMRLFDYFTVQSPNSDFLPNIPLANVTTTAAPTTYAGGALQAVANGPVTNTNMANHNNEPTSNEDTATVEGLININTAPWPVLAMLPMASNPTDNVALAKAIVYFRDVNDGTGAPHGPFTSIFELNAIPAYTAVQLTYTSGNPRFAYALGDPTSTDFTAAQFDLSPSDGVVNDFEQRFAVLTRISNLITTRSDSFTCYILLQGWRNAGTTSATLATERRAAFILDRSGVTQTNRNATRTVVPVN